MQKRRAAIFAVGLPCPLLTFWLICVEERYVPRIVPTLRCQPFDAKLNHAPRNPMRLLRWSFLWKTVGVTLLLTRPATGPEVALHRHVRLKQYELSASAQRPQNRLFRACFPFSSDAHPHDQANRSPRRCVLFCHRLIRSATTEQSF